MDFTAANDTQSYHSIRCDSGDIIVQAVSVFYQVDPPCKTNMIKQKKGVMCTCSKILQHAGLPLFQSSQRLDWAGNSMETHD